MSTHLPLVFLISATMPAASFHHAHSFSTELGKQACSLGYPPGLHLVQLTEIRRQFVLAVPEEIVQSPDGVPLLMGFHGTTDSPWYLNRMGGVSTWLNRYGWIGILPFGLNEQDTNGLGGVRACCSPACDEECCINGRLLAEASTDSACGWPVLNLEGDRPAMVTFVKELVRWAVDHVCIDTNRVFATGFSSGGFVANYLGCHASDVFRAVAPIESSPIDALANTCQLSRPISYVSWCGSLGACQWPPTRAYAERFSKLNNCTGDGPAGAPITVQMSASTNCTLWAHCADGSFVEGCETVGLPHDISGHLRPDDTSFIRPGYDPDAIRHIMEKFSLLSKENILFDGQPTFQESVAQHETQTPLHDHPYLREGRLLGADPASLA